MAIIAVQQPDSNRYRDPLEQVAKALNIAQSVYGIKTAYEQGELRKLQEQKAKLDVAGQERENYFEVHGVMDPKDAQKEYMIDSDPMGAGLIKYKQRFGAEGDTLPIIKIKVPDKNAPEGYKEVFALDKSMVKDLSDYMRTRSIDDRTNKMFAANQTTKADSQEYTRASQIFDDYTRDSKNTLTTLQGYKKVESAALNPSPSGATDIALIFGFMKSIDPGSTVREGEFANAEQAPGRSAQYLNYYNKILTGERLTPEQRMKFLEESKQAVRGQLELQDNIDEKYSKFATKFKVDPSLIVDETFAIYKKKLSENSIKATAAISIPGESQAKADEPFNYENYIIKNENSGSKPPLLRGK